MGGLLCRHSQAFQYAQTGPKGPAKLKQAYLVMPVVAQKSALPGTMRAAILRRFAVFSVRRTFSILRCVVPKAVLRRCWLTLKRRSTPCLAKK
jgi:hypothetical protein